MRAAVVFAIAIAAALMLAVPVAADESIDLDAFRSANLLYEDGNFEEAARSYEHLARLGYEDATLYYNLGNSYYRTDDMGRALLNYLRARRLAPFDDDIEANLALVRQSVGAPGSSNERPTPILAQFAGWLPWVSLNTSVVAALGCWLVVWAVALAVLWDRRLRHSVTLKRVAITAAFGFLLFGCLTVANHSSLNYWNQTGVVIARSTDVMEAPSTRSRVELTLDSGREVSIVETRPGWIRVRLPRTKLDGWVLAANVEPVIPQRS